MGDLEEQGFVGLHEQRAVVHQASVPYAGTISGVRCV
jgi:hypothetical protein